MDPSLDRFGAQARRCRRTWAEKASAGSSFRAQGLQRATLNGSSTEQDRTRVRCTFPPGPACSVFPSHGVTQRFSLLSNARHLSAQGRSPSRSRHNSSKRPQGLGLASFSTPPSLYTSGECLEWQLNERTTLPSNIPPLQ